MFRSQGSSVRVQTRCYLLLLTIVAQVVGEQFCLTRWRHCRSSATRIMRLRACSGVKTRPANCVPCWKQGDLNELGGGNERLPLQVYFGWKQYGSVRILRTGRWTSSIKENTMILIGIWPWNQSMHHRRWSLEIEVRSHRWFTIVLDGDYVRYASVKARILNCLNRLRQRPPVKRLDDSCLWKFS